MLYQLPINKVGSIQGPTILETSPIPPVSQPEMNAYSRISNWQRYEVQTVLPILGLAPQDTSPIPPVSQPNLNYYFPSINRYLWEGPEQLFDGAVSQATFPIPPVSQPSLNHFAKIMNWERYDVPTKLPILGASIMRTDPIPPVSQPLFNYYVPSINRYIDEVIKQVSGSTNVRTDPIPPVSNPLFNYYKPEINRYIDSVVKSLTGGTTQQTYLGFKSLFVWNGSSVVESAVATPISGSSVQQTYLFPLSEPVFNYYRRNTFSDVFFYEHFASATVAQTYIFPLSQPEYQLFSLRTQILRYLVDTTKRFEGSTSVRTDPIPSAYQHMNRYPYRPYSQTITPIDIKIANRTFTYGYFIQ